MIKFDDDEEEGMKLPPPVMKQSCNPEVTKKNMTNYFRNWKTDAVLLFGPQAEPTVLQFLQQYISVYDSDARETLMEAYHNDAVMSLCCAYPSGYTATGQNR